MPQALPILAAVAQAAGYTYAAIALTTAYVGVSVHNQRKAARAQQEAYENSLKDRIVTVRNSAAVQRLVYGRQRVGGDTTIFHCNHVDDKFLVTLIIPVAPHRIDGFEEIWLDAAMDPVSHLDGSSTSSGGGGWVNAGTTWALGVADVLSTQLAGGAPGTTTDLVHPVDQVLAAGYQQVVQGDVYTETLLIPNVDFSVSGSTLTWLTDQSGRTVVFTARYTQTGSVVRVKLYLGLEEGERDPDLEEASGGKWASTDVLQGIARMHLTLRWNREKFGQIGIPNASAVIRGALVRDPVDDSISWSNNAARCMLDYLTREDGHALDYSRINVAAAITAAAISDEWVPSDIITADTAVDTLAIPDQRLRVGDPVRFYTDDTLPAPLTADTTYYIRAVVSAGVYQVAAEPDGPVIDLTSGGSGTSRVMERRYTCDTVLSTDSDIAENVRILLGAMAGDIAKVAGKTVIKAGAFEVPVYTLTENDLWDSEDDEGEWIIDPETPNAELFNGVRGTYVDASETGMWAVTSYPPYVSETYVEQDGWRTRMQDVPLPATLGRQRAQRIAKLTLHLARMSLRSQIPCNWGASPLQPMDVLHAPLPMVGWDAFNDGAGKILRVDQVLRHPSGRVDLQVREEAEVVYDWDFNEATGDPAPNTALPNPNFVEPVEGLAFHSSADTYETLEGGRIRPYGIFSFTAPSADSAVRRGGYIELKWRHATELEFQRIVIDPDDEPRAKVYGLSPGATLVASIRAFNAVQAPSDIRIGVFGVSDSLAFSEISASGNLIPDAVFAADPIQHWRIDKHPFVTELVVWQREPRIPGPPGAAILYQNGTQPSYSTADTDRMSVVAGERYWAYAQLMPVRTDGYVQVAWINAAGVPFMHSPGSLVSQPTILDPRLEGLYAYSDLVMQAPEGAASAFVQIVSRGTREGANSAVIALKPFFGPVGRQTTVRPAWNAGVAPTVGTLQLAPGSTRELESYKQAQPASVGSATPSVLVTPVSRAFGPYPFNTKIIITAECRVQYGNVGDLTPNELAVGGRYGPFFDIAYQNDWESPIVPGGLLFGVRKATPLITANGLRIVHEVTARQIIDLPAGRTLSEVGLWASMPRAYPPPLVILPPVTAPAYLNVGENSISDGVLSVDVSKR
jgi:hypothetical protein